MNQTRTFLFIAWLAVAFLLFQQWQSPAPAQAPQAAAPAAPIAPGVTGDAGSSLPSLPAAATGALPALPGAATAISPAQTVEIVTDTYRLTVDLKGVTLLRSELLTYPKEKKAGSPNVLLLNDDPAAYFVAQSGWLTKTGQAPTHDAVFRTADGKSRYVLAAGQDELSVPFVWQDGNGLTLTKTLVLRRGEFAIRQRQEIRNAGSAPWSGYAYEQLKRLAPPPPPKHAGLTNPDSFSFVGSAWYSAADKFEKVKFADYLDDGVLQSPNKAVADGWFGMLQHHFVSVWVPAKGDTQTFSTATEGNPANPYYLIRGVSGESTVAPGAALSREDVLWAGPKAQKTMAAVHPTLDLSVDYGILSFLAQPLFWLLSVLHGLLGNWGWAIIAIVIVLKLLLFPLSAKQYQSMARMRAIQPRIEALKERYGDDRQKFAMAQMDLYKKEKINPAAGCLPMLIPIPIFLALYWVLVESVELRQAPWIGWVQNLTDADPYFILPVLNLVIMFLTQKLTPTPGMDPLQKKMMTFMPLIFGVMMAFFPAGLVLYWVTNGLLGLAQQWWMTKKYGSHTHHHAAPAK
ncbi:membrane protein insertase YidC [Arenimonas maotaiensis]|uniref:Membrane protein insertase YidC n=1 Tax=Arenimonas maotaiensis TaxID=1446479 RepID=A0A917CP55_9GAMM|nr:membrane protein insertase YidC [Arenimonas maotaiensis]GGF94533.1 membrane protein insertase YidC [Arenimonas maotaiensis]